MHVLAFDHHHHPCAHCSSQRTGTSIRTTVTTGVVVAVISTFVPLSELAELVNIGTLFALILVAVGVLVRPDLERPFSCPVSPLSRSWQC